MIDASTQCPRCGSVELIPRVRVTDRDGGTRYDLQIEVHRRPNAFLLKRPERTNLVATVCASCGLTQFTAEMPGSLYAAYRQSDATHGDSAVEELERTQEALIETQSRLHELEEKLAFLESLLQPKSPPRELSTGPDSTRNK